MHIILTAISGEELQSGLVFAYYINTEFRGGAKGRLFAYYINTGFGEGLKAGLVFPYYINPGFRGGAKGRVFVSFLQASLRVEVWVEFFWTIVIVIARHISAFAV